MGTQGTESDQNMQERMRVESSSRMENLAKTGTHEQDTDSEKQRSGKETIDSSLMRTQGPKSGPNIQERMRAKSSTRMENLARLEPREQDPDSEKKRTEKKTIISSHTGAQDPKSGPNIQERMRIKSSTRMENFAQMEPHEKDPNPETKRTEKKTVNFSLTEAQGPESGSNIQERMRIKSSTRMEKLSQTNQINNCKKWKGNKESPRS